MDMFSVKDAFCGEIESFIEGAVGVKDKLF